MHERDRLVGLGEKRRQRVLEEARDHRGALDIGRLLSELSRREPRPPRFGQAGEHVETRDRAIRGHRVGDDPQCAAGRDPELEGNAWALDLAERITQRVRRLPEHLRPRHVLLNERRALLRRMNILRIRNVPPRTVFGVCRAGDGGLGRLLDPAQRGLQLGDLVRCSRRAAVYSAATTSATARCSFSRVDTLNRSNMRQP